MTISRQVIAFRTQNLLLRWMFATMLLLFGFYSVAFSAVVLVRSNRRDNTARENSFTFCFATR